MDILGLIGFVLSITAISFLSYRLIVVQRSLSNMAEKVVQLGVDKWLLLDRIEKLSQIEDSKSIEQTDGFIKFLSQSRDWAFEYIEQVQTALTKFDKEIEPILFSYKLDLDESSHTEKLNKISLAYSELKSLLPEDDKPNN